MTIFSRIRQGQVSQSRPPAGRLRQAAAGGATAAGAVLTAAMAAVILNGDTPAAWGNMGWTAGAVAAAASAGLMGLTFHIVNSAVRGKPADGKPEDPPETGRDP